MRLARAVGDLGHLEVRVDLGRDDAPARPRAQQLDVLAQVHGHLTGLEDRCRRRRPARKQCAPEARRTPPQGRRVGQAKGGRGRGRPCEHVRRRPRGELPRRSVEERAGDRRRRAGAHSGQSGHRVRPQRVVVLERSPQGAQTRTGRHEPREEFDRRDVATSRDQAQAAGVEEVAGEQRGLPVAGSQRRQPTGAIVDEIALVDELDRLGECVVTRAVERRRTEVPSAAPQRRRWIVDDAGGPAAGPPANGAATVRRVASTDASVTTTTRPRPPSERTTAT